MTKAEARKTAKANIAKMSDAEREWASGAIIDAVSALDAFRKAKSVFIYLGTSTEPDTQEIVGLALAMEKTVAVPRVRGENMDAVIITPFSNFRENKWGILEPAEGYIMTEAPEVAVVPLVAFDGLNRAGHGKGYYDRYLAEHKCKTIGLAFDCQRVSGLEIDRHDVPLNVLVTEKVIIPSARKTVENAYCGTETVL